MIEPPVFYRESPKHLQAVFFEIADNRVDLPDLFRDGYRPLHADLIGTPDGVTRATCVRMERLDA